MKIDELPLLENGADLTGREVDYWGHRWTVCARNYLGDWDVVRFEDRQDGRYRINSSICQRDLPEEHPHHAKLVPVSGAERF